MEFCAGCCQSMNFFIDVTLNAYKWKTKLLLLFPIQVSPRNLLCDLLFLEAAKHTPYFPHSWLLQGNKPAQVKK